MTHMVSGYAPADPMDSTTTALHRHQSKGEFVIVRKMAKVDWLGRPAKDALPVATDQRSRGRNTDLNLAGLISMKARAHTRGQTTNP
jgi:hypothetical protein